MRWNKILREIFSGKISEVNFSIISIMDRGEKRFEKFLEYRREERKIRIIVRFLVKSLQIPVKEILEILLRVERRNIWIVLRFWQLVSNLEIDFG